MRITFLTFLFLSYFSSSSHGQFKQDSTKKVNYAAIPLVSYDNATGAGIGLMTQAFYKLNSLDTISPSSSTGLFGLYTTNNTYFAAVFQRIYMREDRWRIVAAAGLGNVNFQYWQELPIVEGAYIAFNTQVLFGMMQVERKVYKQLYAGVNMTYSKVNTAFDVPDFVPDSLKNDERNMNSLGYLFNYDTRDNQMNPYTGFNVEFKNYYYREWIGGTDDFTKFELTYNHFHTLGNERNILATRVKSSFSTGDVPFQGESIVGRDDIRGYSSGKYRANQVYSMQAEYRWRFYKKLGMVGFFGLASAVDVISDIPKTQLLPGVGAGFRYMMIPKERINIGIDVAVGKDDWGVYFRIGEAFGR